MKILFKESKNKISYFCINCKQYKHHWDISSNLRNHLMVSKENSFAFSSICYNCNYVMRLIWLEDYDIIHNVILDTINILLKNHISDLIENRCNKIKFV